jgi:ubiquinone/menaquinone biosynthesis C-methylase UbiE
MNKKHALVVLLAAYILCGQTTLAKAEAKKSHEESVSPGINAKYFQQDVVLEDWLQNFERKDRELFANRFQIVQKSAVKPGSRVADIGAGTGFFTLLLAKQVGPKGHVYAVDIKKEFIDFISKRAKDAKQTNVESRLGKEDSIGLPANSIDLAFVCDTYHHFEYPHSVLASIYSALRPGGRLVLIDLRKDSSEWAKNHVRADKKVFIAEVEKAGFIKESEPNFLKENFMATFKKRPK